MDISGKRARERRASIKDTNVEGYLVGGGGGNAGREEEGGRRSGGEGEREGRRVRVTWEGADLTLNPGQVIHLHLEFRLRRACIYVITCR